MTVIYWQVGGEPVGVAGMLLSACLAGMVGFYVWFTQKRIGVTLPEDNLTAEISDGAGELGFYSPHSWWPLPVAMSACVFALELPEVDGRGVKRAGAIRNKIRSRMSVAHSEAIPKVSADDLKEIEH